MIIGSGESGGGGMGETVGVTQTGSVGQTGQVAVSKLPAWSAFQGCYLEKTDVSKLES